jgi:hypothetical protein
VQPDNWEFNLAHPQPHLASALERARRDRARYQLLREEARIANAALELQLRQERELRDAWRWRSPRLLNLV